MRGVYRGKPGWWKDADQLECDAYRIELACLRNRIRQCVDRECIDQIAFGSRLSSHKQPSTAHEQSTYAICLVWELLLCGRRFYWLFEEAYAERFHVPQRTDDNDP